MKHYLKPPGQRPSGELDFCGFVWNLGFEEMRAHAKTKQLSMGVSVSSRDVYLGSRGYYPEAQTPLGTRGS